VPIADLFSHAEQENVLWDFNSTSQCFELTCKTDIARGEALNLSYGADKHNRELLLMYGFVISSPTTAHDIVRVRFRLSARGNLPVDTTYSRKVKNRLLGLGWAAHLPLSLSLDLLGDTNAHSLSALRLAFAEPHEVRALDARGQLKRAKKGDVPRLPPLSLACELRVAGAILTAVALHIRALTLNSQGLPHHRLKAYMRGEAVDCSSNAANVLRVLAGEVRILQKWREIVLAVRAMGHYTAHWRAFHDTFRELDEQGVVRHDSNNEGGVGFAAGIANHSVNFAYREEEEKDGEEMVRKKQNYFFSCFIFFSVSFFLPLLLLLLLFFFFFFFFFF
jgi:hypothetical protein